VSDSVRNNLHQLPLGWCWSSFSTVAKIASNLVSPEEWKDKPHIAPDNIERDTGRLLPYKTIEEDRVISPKHLFVPGQLLYSKIRPYLNKCVHISFQGLCSADMYPLDAHIEAKYLHYYILSQQFVSAVTAAAGSRTVLPKTNQEQLSEVPVPVAPAFEQNRIAAALDSYLTRLDAAAEGLKRVEANLKRYRASVLKAAVEGRLVPAEAELARKEGREYESASVLLKRILGNRRSNKEPVMLDTSSLPSLPEGWCWASVDMVGDVLLGRQRAPQYLTGKHTKPYLRVANIKDDRIDFSDLEGMDFDAEHFTKYRLRANDILISEGQSPELVGQSAIYRGEKEELCFQKTLHRFRPVELGPSAEFAQLVFRSHVKTGLFMSLASITTNIAHLTLEKFKAAPFPLPPLSEQARIVSEAARLLSDGDAIGESTKVNAQRITRLRQSILKWAFEGKLVDQDPNDEPASVLLERIRKERAASSESSPKRGRPRKAAEKSV
jgi:type I restriction enzyme S subunit